VKMERRMMREEEGEKEVAWGGEGGCEWVVQNRTECDDGCPGVEDRALAKKDGHTAPHRPYFLLDISSRRGRCPMSSPYRTLGCPGSEYQNLQGDGGIRLPILITRCLKNG
jgi:hypothetical protein